MPQAGADGSTIMIIGFGLLFIAYAFASFAVIKGLIFPYLAQGAPVAAVFACCYWLLRRRVGTADHDPLVLYKSEALTSRRSGIAPGRRCQ